MISCVKSSDFWHFSSHVWHLNIKGCVTFLKEQQQPFPLSPMQKRIVLLKQPYSCSKCVKKFPLPHDLKEHERTHGAEPFRCLQCDKRFSLFDELKQHKRSHVGEEPFKCTKCDKKFALGSELKAHERTHTDEEPFSCFQCDKKFKHFSDMKQH